MSRNEIGNEDEQRYSSAVIREIAAEAEVRNRQIQVAQEARRIMSVVGLEKSERAKHLIGKGLFTLKRVEVETIRLSRPIKLPIEDVIFTSEGESVVMGYARILEETEEVYDKLPLPMALGTVALSRRPLRIRGALQIVKTPAAETEIDLEDYKSQSYIAIPEFVAIHHFDDRVALGNFESDIDAMSLGLSLV